MKSSVYGKYSNILANIWQIFQYFNTSFDLLAPLGMISVFQWVRVDVTFSCPFCTTVICSWPLSILKFKEKMCFHRRFSGILMMWRREHTPTMMWLVAWSHSYDHATPTIMWLVAWSHSYDHAILRYPYDVEAWTHSYDDVVGGMITLLWWCGWWHDHTPTIMRFWWYDHTPMMMVAWTHSYDDVAWSHSYDHVVGGMITLRFSGILMMWRREHTPTMMWLVAWSHSYDDVAGGVITLLRSCGWWYDHTPMMMWLVAWSHSYDDVAGGVITLLRSCGWWHDHTPMMMWLVASSHSYDDVAGGVITLLWWCGWWRDHTPMMMWLVAWSHSYDDDASDCLTTFQQWLIWCYINLWYDGLYGHTRLVIICFKCNEYKWIHQVRKGICFIDIIMTIEVHTWKLTVNHIISIELSFIQM